MRIHVALAIVAMAPALATAEPAQPSFEPYMVGAFSGGVMQRGPYEFEGGGLVVQLGLDIGRLHLVADQTLMMVQTSTGGEDRSGVFARTGFSVRLPIGEWLSMDGGLGGYIEAGVGRQRLPAQRLKSRWDASIGWMTSVRVPYVGFVLGSRFVAAPTRERGAFVAVAGTAKRNDIDVGVLVTLGARIGGRRKFDRTERRTLVEQAERGDLVGFEYSIGRRQLFGRSYFAGTVAARRSFDIGALSLGGEGAVGILTHSDSDVSSVSDDGLVARIGATAKYSLWRPRARLLRGDFFLDGGAGYSIGSVSSGRFKQLDIRVGGGAGYELLVSDRDSPARNLAIYLAVRALVPAHHRARIGWTFGLGLAWRR